VELQVYKEVEGAWDNARV